MGSGGNMFLFKSLDHNQHALLDHNQHALLDHNQHALLDHEQHALLDHLMEFVRISRHLGPRRVWIGGSELRAVTHFG